MICEVVYFSKTGNTRKVAHALADAFPVGSCKLVDIALEKPSVHADIYLIGFGVHRGACPYLLLEWLEELHDKKIIFFATGGLAAFQDYHKRIESLILPFLPESCEYLGMYLCEGKISQEGYAYLKSCLSKPDDSSSLQNLNKIYEHSQTHPDQQDLENACHFLRSVL